MRYKICDNEFHLDTVNKYFATIYSVIRFGEEVYIMSKQLRMPSVSAVVARSEPGKFIGINNALPWHLKTDLQIFKRTTVNHVIIMGRKTYDSIGKPLPNRINIVLTRSNLEPQKNLIPVSDPETALLLADWHTMWQGNDTSFIVGGGQVYNLFEKYMNEVFLTLVNAPDIHGDASFDWEFEPKTWKTKFEEEYPASEDDEYSFRFCKFERKRKLVRDRQKSEFMAHGFEVSEWMENYYEKEEDLFLRTMPRKVDEDKNVQHVLSL